MDIIPIDLDRTRHVKLDIGTMRKIDKYLEPNTLIGVMKKAGENFISLDVIVMFYYYSLVWEDNTLTDKKIEELITNALNDGVEMVEFFDVMAEMIQNFWDREEKAEESKKKLRKVIVR